MSTLTWTKSQHEPRAYETSIGDLDVRVVGVDDLWFIKTRTGSAPFAHPNGTPSYQHTLRDAKIAVQRVADRKVAQA